MWGWTAQTMVLRTQGSLDIDWVSPPDIPKAFMYVNNTIEILTTFVHLLIQQSLGSFPHVQVCVHTVGSMVGTEWDESQDRKKLGTCCSPLCAGKAEKEPELPQSNGKEACTDRCSPVDPACAAPTSRGSTWKHPNDADPKPTWTSWVWICRLTVSLGDLFSESNM